MIYLLDTNVCIRFLNGRAPSLVERLLGTPEEEVAVCSVVKAEMFYGAMKSTDPPRTLAVQIEFVARFRSFPFDDAAAHEYGRIRAELEQHGTPIGPNDLMIAAIALANDLTLVTHNTRHFGRIAGLLLEDWETV